MVPSLDVPNEIDKYVIQKRLGGGAFGEVFLVYDRGLDCLKALKLIRISNPDSLLQSLSEAHIQDKLRHKHIVRINEANIFTLGSAQVLALDLEYLPQGSLEREMGNRWISAKEACSRLSSVLCGLHYAHAKGYLHRDVKPGNVLIDGHNTKLSDFGLATAPLNFAGSAKAYLSHCAPEVYQRGSTTVLTDVYAAGITLFRVINNISDWDSRLKAMPSADDLMRTGGLTTKIGYHGSIPNQIIRIVRKACHEDASKRYATARAMQSDLDGLRFGIDWSLVGEDLWSGNESGVTHDLGITMANGAFMVEYRKGGRKVSDLCFEHASLAAARCRVEAVVKRTTLKR